MKIFKKQKGSSLVISLGIMSLLLILSGAVMATIFRSVHLTNNVANSNKAYFAAESGLEEALYELSNHLSGFETSSGTTFTNNAKYDYEIEYQNTTGRIPRTGEGNSPNHTDWNKIAYKGTYNLNLFYDNSTKGNKTKYDCTSDCTNIVNPSAGTLELHVQTPNSEVLTNDEIFVTWVITGLSKSDPNKKYTLLPITNKSDLNYSEISGSKINASSQVLTLTTQGENLEGTQQNILAFLSNADLHMPKLKISAVSELNSNMNQPFPYLEFYVDSDITLPDSYATITSEGYTAMSKQTIQTKIKQEGALSLFDYAIFQ